MKIYVTSLLFFVGAVAKSATARRLGATPTPTCPCYTKEEITASMDISTVCDFVSDPNELVVVNLYTEAITEFGGQDTVCTYKREGGDINGFVEAERDFTSKSEVNQQEIIDQFNACGDILRDACKECDRCSYGAAFAPDGTAVWMDTLALDENENGLDDNGN